MSRVPGRARLVVFTITLLLLATAVAFFSGLIIQGRFDGAPAISGQVMEYHKPTAVIEFVAPNGQRCRSNVVPSDITAGLAPGTMVAVRALPPSYCADVELDGDAANHAAQHDIAFGLTALAALLLIGYGWRHQHLAFGADRAASGPVLVAYRVDDLAQAFRLIVPILSTLGLLVFIARNPGFPAFGFVIGAIAVFGYGYLAYWRTILRLEVQGSTLRWLGVLRRGEIAVADITSVGVKRRRRGRVAIFARVNGPDLVVAAGPGLTELVQALAGMSPNLLVEPGTSVSG